MIEPIPIQNRTHFITDEWGFAPTSSTAALMLKRAEKMKWNSERKHKREHMGLSIIHRFKYRALDVTHIFYIRCFSTFKSSTSK